MLSENFYKKMFFLGALWNIVGGITVMALTGWIFKVQALNPPIPANYYYSWITLFMTFGVGYYMIYRDMYANKNIVILGIIAKLTFAFIFIYYMVLCWGQIPYFFILAVAGDIIFAVLFIMFLNFAKKTQK